MRFDLDTAPLEPVQVAVFERLRGECAELRLTLRSGQKSPTDRHREVREMIGHVERLADKTPGLSLAEQTVRPSLRTGSKMLSSAHSSATVYLRLALGDEADLLDLTEQLGHFLDLLPAVGKGEYAPGTVKLAVYDPEAHREALIRKLIEHATQLKALWGAGHHVEITGLESSVLVWQVSRREVALALDYKLSIRG